MSHPLHSLIVGAFAFTIIVTDAFADEMADSIAVGSYPYAAAVNQITNRIYVTNYNSGNITVIDGAAKKTSTVATGTNPRAVAVNTVNNKIYVVNFGSNSVTVIDGITNLTSSVATGTNPCALAINPKTNKIYVANFGSSNVSVIDGETYATSTVAAGAGPIAITVNPVANKIYVANNGSGTVTVIDGMTNNTSTIPVGVNPYSITVNSVTNKIYVANNGSSTVSVINGATNQTTVSGVKGSPTAIVVNQATNMVYAASSDSAVITIINGATDAITTISAGLNPWAIAVNPITNKAYIANNGSNSVTVIDCSNNTTSTFAVKRNPCALAVNPVTNMIYIANGGSDSCMVINGISRKVSVMYKNSDMHMGIAVNPITNRIYATNYYNNSVSVLDGATNFLISTITVGTNPTGIAVNPVTNMIYCSNLTSHNALIIDGATNLVTSTLNMGSAAPYGTKVDPVTNTVYIANYQLTSLSVVTINGATEAVGRISNLEGLGWARGLAINPVTKKLYIANTGTGATLNNGITIINLSTGIFESGISIRGAYDIAINNYTNKIYATLMPEGSQSVLDEIAIIDATTNKYRTIKVGKGPTGIALNPLTNKIYVANTNNGTVTIIDGFSEKTSSVSVGYSPRSIAVNPVTNRVYCGSESGIFVIEESPTYDTKLWAASDILPFNSTTVNKPIVTGMAVNRQRPGHTGIWGVGTSILPVDRIFSLASITSRAGTDSVLWSSSLGTDTLLPGENFLSSFALDSTSTTLNSCGLGTPFTGNLSIRPVYRLPQLPPTVIPVLLSPSNDAVDQPVAPILTWNSVPGATSYSLQVSTDLTFATKIINQPMITSPTYSINGLTNYTKYYWRVCANNTIGSSPWSEIWNFKTIANAPTAPILSSPANGAIGISVTPVFSWQPQVSATSYSLQISATPDFSSTVVNKNDILSSSFNALGLSLSATYYWRVSVTNSAGTSPWSAPWSFTTNSVAPPAPAIPTIVSPANFASGIPVNPTMKWNTTPNATSYGLQLSAVSNFSSFIRDSSGITDTVLTTTGLINNIQYYWRVNATNAAGASGWSSTANFTTIVSLPSIVTVISPHDTAKISTDSVLLVWQKATPVITKYLLHVATDSAFTQLFALDSTISDTSKLVKRFSANVTYWWRVRAGNAAGWGPFSQKMCFIRPVTSVLPKNFEINHLNYNSSSKLLRYSLPVQCRVTIKYFDIKGRLIFSFIGKVQNPGFHSIALPVSYWPKGTYVQVFEAGSFTRKDRLVIMQ